VNDVILTKNYDAFIVCFSITDKSSMQTAVDIVKCLRSGDKSCFPIILVGNKSDLARKRDISRDGKIFLGNLRYLKNLIFVFF
jgi:GTPase SAR1 family protein